MSKILLIVWVLIALLLPYGLSATLAQDSGGHPPITSENAGQMTELARLGEEIEDWGPALAWSPDGKMLALLGGGFSDADIWLYDVETLDVRHQLKGHPGDVKTVAFSPDGALLASGDDDGTLLLWDVATAEQLAVLEPPYGGVKDVAFSPDGMLLAVGDYSGVTLWDATTTEQFAVLEGHAGRVQDVAFSPDGTLLASSDSEAIRLWDVATAKQLAVLEGHTGPAWEVAFSADGALLASAGNDGVLLLWDVATAEQIAVLEGHPWTVQSVAFSPASALLASSGNDGTVRLWDTTTAEQIAVLEGHPSVPVNIAFNPDGTLLASRSTVDAVLWGLPDQPTLETRLQLYLNADETLTLDPPPANSESRTECYFPCDLTWTGTLAQPLEGNVYGYQLVSARGDFDVRILHTRGDQQTVLAEWIDGQLSGQKSGPELDALSGDTITLEITMPEAGSMRSWDYGDYSFITIGATEEPLPPEPPGPPPESPEAEAHPTLAIGPGDQVHWAWADMSSGDWDVYYARSGDGGDSFSEPVPLATGAPGTQRGHPALAVGSDGSVHVVWESWQDNNWDIYYTRSGDGGATFSQPIRVNDVTELDQLRPALAVDSEGIIHIVWQDSRSHDWDIFYASSTDGGASFEPSLRINDETIRDQEDPVNDTHDQGRIHVAWADKRDGAWHIYHAYSIDGGFSASHPVGTGGLADKRPSLVAGPHGTVYVAWSNGYINQPAPWGTVTLNLPAYAISADGGETFSDPQNLINDYQYVSIGAQETSLFVDGDAVHAIAVTSSVREGNLLWHLRSTGGDWNFGTPAQIAEANEPFYQSVLAVDANERVHVAWASEDTTVHYARADAAGQPLSIKHQFTVER